MSELQEFASDDTLKKALTKALRDLDAAKRKNAELVEAVYNAAVDAAQGLKYEPVSHKSPKRGDSGHSETAISPLADWQLGKLTPSYSSDVCAERIAKLGDKVADLTAIQRQDHPVPDCRVYLLGDLIEGELIFPGQAHRIDASLFRQVMLDGPQILGDYLRRMLSIFETVHVEGVIGNHGALGGRGRRDMHPETNADAMMYETTRIMLQAEDRLTWGPTFTPGERNWFAIDSVRGKTFFLFHGDQVKGGFAGHPWYGFGKKLGGYYQLYGPFDYAMSGHFHTTVRATYPGSGEVVHWGSGSPESDNTYAAEMLAASGSPSQWLMFVSDAGVSAEYEVRLGAT